MGKTSVRYVVDDINSAIAFYTTLLGFEIDMNPGPGFAALERGELRLLLNVPGSGGAGQATPRGVPESGDGTASSFRSIIWPPPCSSSEINTPRSTARS